MQTTGEDLIMLRTYPLISVAIAIAAIVLHLAAVHMPASQEALKTTTAEATLYIIGDSTVNNHGNGLLGWGDPIAEMFDKAKIRVVNRARGGRSSRTFR